MFRGEEYGFGPNEVLDPKEGTVITDEKLRRIGAASREYREAYEYNSRMLAEHTAPFDPYVAQSAKKWSEANERLQAVCKQEGIYGIQVVQRTSEPYVPPMEREAKSSQSGFFKFFEDCFSSCCGEKDENKSLLRNRR